MAGEIHLSLCQMMWVPMSRGGPAQFERFEMMLAEFAGDDDGRQEADAHAEGDALPDCLNAGKLGYVGGTNVRQGENAVEFLAGKRIPIQ